MKFREFDKKLNHWYKSNYRDLPWRKTQDPYRIWLSEIILQQTRVAQGLPYYEKFIDKFPTLEELAKASEEEVLRLWQGLGYYSRARNLMKCARVVYDDYSGRFPSDYDSLKKLPGIGPYTAAAIASFAFKQPVAVVDGNVYRVLSRIFGLKEDIAKTSSAKFFKDFSEKLIPTDEPDIYNQALMEYGATVCLPKNPDCQNCEFASMCYANEHNEQGILPIKSKSVKVKVRRFFYLFFYNEKGAYLRKRGVKDIWAQMYDFLWVDVPSLDSPDRVLEQAPELKEVFESANNIDLSNEVRHILSHQKLETQFIKINLGTNNGPLEYCGQKLNFYSWDEVAQMPKPVLIANFLEQEGYEI